MENLLKNYSLLDPERAVNIWKESVKEGKGLNNFTNPEVPMTIIFGSHINTNKKVSY